MRVLSTIACVIFLLLGLLTAAANDHRDYRALRDGVPGESYTVTNLQLKRDIGVFTLAGGTVSFLPPVLDKVAAAVFVGEGEFRLAPSVGTEIAYLDFLTGKEEVREPFSKLVLWFTDETYDEIKRQARPGGSSLEAADLLRGFRQQVRRNSENPRSLLEAMLAHEEVENIEAEVLSSLYDQSSGLFFSAYISGKNYKDLRFHIRPRSVLPGELVPEEVALINFDPGHNEEGFWYLAHLKEEYDYNTASSDEDGRVIEARHYQIETEIDGEELKSRTELTFTGLSEGARILRFGLLPTLRVQKVSLNGAAVSHIQEKKDEDASFYVIFPEALMKGHEYKLVFEYEGNKVIDDAGGGNFAVGARTSWYPSVNAFNDRATFDLTFKVHKRYVLVSVGELQKQTTEGDLAITRWISEVPLAVAGFNYGRFKKKDTFDKDTNYRIEGYATSGLPGYLRSAGEIVGGLSPTRLTENAMVQAQNSVRVFSYWFGPAPYGRIAITQQPEFNFGQSWPTLVYLPIVAFFDSTQRWRLYGEYQQRVDQLRSGGHTSRGGASVVGSHRRMVFLP